MFPTVHVRRVDDRLVTGVADRQAEAYGFNSGLPWDRSEIYIRWLASDSDSLEYDMDEQDRIWLDAFNADRRKDGSDPVSYEFFEILLDRLEKEWFALARRIPRPPSALPPEDGRCAVCDDGECENSNAIVFCDGCNLAVHQDCYGIPYIPEGQWLCRKCTVSPDKPVTCILCSTEFGAFKQTYSGAWAHLLCAIWVPETGVSNTDYMEPVDGIEAIPKSRWKLVCYLCKKRTGACIQCSNKSCFTAFHATCARDYGLHLSLRPQNAHYDGPSDNRAYCHRHTPRPNGLPHDHDPAPPKWPMKRRNTSSKASRAYLKSYTTGPPVVPQYIYDRIHAYTDRIKVRKKAQVIEAICKYWSLKREMRRSAPLLKRLHLEPWTASTTSGHQTDGDKARMLQLIVRLRQDLEKVRMLADFVRKREKEKLRRAQLLQSAVEPIFFPIDDVLRSVLQKVVALDRMSLFLNPVSAADVPDYATVIKHPMDWSTINSKIDRNEYLTPKEFQDDIALVLSNAKLYNSSDTTFYKTAARLETTIEPILKELDPFSTPEWQKIALEQICLLEDSTIQSLFEYNYDKPEPTAPAPAPTPAPSFSQVPAPRRTRGSIAASASIEDSSNNNNTKDIPTTPTIPNSKQPPTPRPRPVDEDREEKLRIKRERERERRALKKAASQRGNEGASSTRSATRQTVTQAESNNKNDNNVSPSPSPSSPDTTSASVYVQSVENIDLFKKFDSGWILPDGARRKRLQQSYSLPPAKRVRKNPSNSSSSVTTSTVSAAPRAEVPEVENPTPVPKQTDVVLQSESSELSELSDLSDIDADAEADEDADADGEVDESVTTVGVQNIAVEDTRETEAHETTHIIETSDTTHKDISASPNKAKLTHREWDQRLSTLKAQSVVDPDTKLPDRTLVWAKMPGFPEFPAEIADEKDPIVPPDVLSAKKPEQSHLVMFFDKPQRSWQWVASSKMWMLGVDTELDDTLLSQRHLGRKRASVLSAYKMALETV